MKYYPGETTKLTSKEGHYLSWWLDWGGTPLKMYQGSSMVCSEVLETLFRVQKQKQA